MQFDPPLVPGTLVKRYKRFLADIVLATGETITAHCANPGAMTGLAEPGARVFVSPNTNPKAKLDWRWELVEARDTEGPALVCINTARANGLVEEHARTQGLPGFTAYQTIQREVRYADNSRIDLLLSEPGLADVYIEIKSVTLSRPSPTQVLGTGDAAPNTLPKPAEFPDAKTERGVKHLQALGQMVENGARAVMLFLVMRDDCHYFQPAADIDPLYAATLQEAMARGVEVLCYSARVTQEGLWFGEVIDDTRI